MNAKKLTHTHIERIIQKKPLVQSHHLLSLGIAPGEKMGKLLKKAEEIAINENLQKTQHILDRLFL